MAKHPACFGSLCRIYSGLWWGFYTSRLITYATCHSIVKPPAVQAAETANAELALRLAQQQEIDAEKTAQLAADQQMVEARTSGNEV